MKTDKRVYQRKDGRWEARYCKGYNEDGKIVYGSVYGASKDEVIQKRRNIVGEDDSQNEIPSRLNLLILGAGAHGKDVKALAESLRVFYKISFLDDIIENEEVIGKCTEAVKLKKQYVCAFVAIGDPKKRKKFTKLLKECNFLIPSLISPQANISPYAKIGEGVAILPQATVNEATVGDFCILASNSLVSSNAEVGAFTHVDCGGIISRNCIVPEGTWIGIGEVYK